MTIGGIFTLPVAIPIDMLIPPEIKPLLAAIRRLAKEMEVEARYVSDFTRLYRFYLAMEGPGPEEPGTEPAARFGSTDRQDFRTVNATPELRAFFTDAVAARERYTQRIAHYLLLKSFYNAFVFPLEQDVSIARSTQALGVTAIGFTGGKEITPPQLETLRSAATEALLIQMRSAFEAMGRISFPDTFNANDFTNTTREQI